MDIYKEIEKSDKKSWEIVVLVIKLKVKQKERKT